MSIIDTFTTKLGNFIGLNTNNLLRASQGFDTAQFKSQVLGDAGIMRSNLFLVSIQFPQAFAQTQTNLMKLTPRTLMMFTEQASLPGMSIGSDDQIKRYGTGPAEKMPHSIFFADITFNFLADGNGEILKMFHNWMRYIVNFDSRKNGPTGLNNADPYEVGYKDDYAAQIEITVFSEAADKIITYTLNDVFPIFLGEIALSWADTDSIMRVPVTFSYRDWQSDAMSVTALRPGVGNNLTLLQKILKVGTAVQAISAMRRPRSVADVVNVVNNANILSRGVSGIF